MADTELASMTEETDPTTTDLIYLTDSGGTIDRKLALSNLLEYVPDLSAIAALATTDVVPIIDDPSGTPLQAKITTLNLVKAAMGLTTSEEFEIREVLHEETLASAGKFDVTGIPSDYTHLLLHLNARSDVAAIGDAALMYFNNDTTDTNYMSAYMTLLNASSNSGETDKPLVYLSGGNSTAGDFRYSRIFLPNYASTTYRKNAIMATGGRRDANEMRIGQVTTNWESTAAINRITIQADNDPTDQLVAGSYLMIVGIKTSV